MKKCILISIIAIIHLHLAAQDNRTTTGKIFWRENFDSGKIPEGWINKALNDSSLLWECTNQPYPGSYGFDRQAPPIASGSGGAAVGATGGSPGAGGPNPDGGGPKPAGTPAAA